MFRDFTYTSPVLFAQTSSHQIDFITFDTILSCNDSDADIRTLSGAPPGKWCLVRYAVVFIIFHQLFSSEPAPRRRGPPNLCSLRIYNRPIRSRCRCPAMDFIGSVFDRGDRQSIVKMNIFSKRNRDLLLIRTAPWLPMTDGASDIVTSGFP